MVYYVLPTMWNEGNMTINLNKIKMYSLPSKCNAIVRVFPSGFPNLRLSGPKYAKYFWSNSGTRGWGGCLEKRGLQEGIRVA